MRHIQGSDRAQTLRHFLMRGLRQVRAEFSLGALAYTIYRR